MKAKKNVEKPLFARNINYLRFTLGMSRKETAKLVGVQVGTWSSYEDGRAFPRTEILPRICKVLQYRDLLSMITEDLSTSKKKTAAAIDVIEAVQSLKKIEKFILQKENE